MKNISEINFLVGCEESQAITMELRKLGVNAFSCDLKECSGGHPEWHIHGDIFEAINGHTNGLPKVGWLKLQTGDHVFIDKWYAAIFHPDCTYMTVSGLHWNKRNPERAAKTEASLQFVCDLLNSGIENIRLENPIGCISTRVAHKFGKYYVRPIGSLINDYRAKPSEIIQPYQFGDDASKATCLWNVGFPKLNIDPKDYFPPRIVDGKKRWGNQTDDGQNKLMIDGKWIAFNDPRTKTYRSKTYPGIAKAIAKQSVEFLLNPVTENQTKLF